MDDIKNPGGKPRHVPTEETRQKVMDCTARGVVQKSICQMLGITDKTLVKYYRAELDIGTDDANFQIAGALFKKALKGDTGSMIFWLKTRGGWREKDREEEKPSEIAQVSKVVIEIAK
jgi:hypothetical protein